MDSDIAIVDDLTIPDEWRGGIYAVLDFHTNLSKAINRKKILNNAKMMGFSPILNDEIFNGGVMFAADTPEAREFFKTWHELWLYCVSKNFPYDMASLAETNYKFGYITKKMDGGWNCQLAYAGTASLLMATDSCRRRKCCTSLARALSIREAARFRNR